MIKIFNPVSLDVAKANEFAVVLAKQGDQNSRFIIATVNFNGSAIRIPPDSKVRLNVIRADGAGASFNGYALADGNVTVPLDRWVTSVAGEARCSVEITNGTQVLTTMRFTVKTEESDDVSDLNDPEIFPTDPEYDAVLELLDDYSSGRLGGADVYIRYSAYPDGTGFTSVWSEDQYYIGFASGMTAPVDKSGYVWSRFVGNVNMSANVTGDIGTSETDAMSQKAVTDELYSEAELTWENGAINGDSGIEYDSDTVCRAVGFFDVRYIRSVSVKIKKQMFFYNARKEYLSTITVPANSTMTQADILSHGDVRYIRIRSNWGETANTVDKVTVYEDVKVKKCMTDSDKGLEELDVRVTSLEYPPEDEIYTPTLDGYFTTSLKFITYNNAFRTDYISVKKHKYVYARARLASSGYALAFFDEDHVPLPSVSVIGGGVNSDNVINMAIPESAAYCVLSHYGTTAPSFIRLYNTEVKSPLRGKVINAFGDSITSVDYTTPNWWQIIRDRTLAEFNDYGKSASSLAVRAERTDSFAERVTDLNADADGVIVMGGTNDWNTPLGAWDSDDTATLYGALNVIIKSLITRFAGKPIMFCTPIQTAASHSSNVLDPLGQLCEKTETDTTSLQQKAEAIKAKCAQYGLPCLDLYNLSGINGADDSKVYYIEDDNLHPSELGMKRMANLIGHELEKYFEPEN